MNISMFLLTIWALMLIFILVKTYVLSQKIATANIVYIQNLAVTKAICQNFGKWQERKMMLKSIYKRYIIRLSLYKNSFVKRVLKILEKVKKASKTTYCDEFSDIISLDIENENV